MKSADGRFEYRDHEDEPVAPGTPPDQVHRFAFVCRRSALAAAGAKPHQLGPASFCSLNLRGRGHDVEKQSWTWDGNVDQPGIMAQTPQEGTAMNSVPLVATMEGPLRPYIDLNEFLIELVKLFEREPELPKQLCDLRLGYESSGQVPALFDYLFVQATGPAMGDRSQRS